MKKDGRTARLGVRVKPDHRDAVTNLATVYGMTRSDVMGAILDHVLGHQAQSALLHYELRIRSQTSPAPAEQEPKSSTVQRMQAPLADGASAATA